MDGLVCNICQHSEIAVGGQSTVDVMQHIICSDIIMHTNLSTVYYSGEIYSCLMFGTSLCSTLYCLRTIWHSVPDCTMLVTQYVMAQQYLPGYVVIGIIQCVVPS